MEIGPQAKSENKFTKKCRLHQSRYRARVLNEPYGVGPNKSSKSEYGNMLKNGETTGSNFISKAAFEFAKEKVKQKQVNKFLMIDEYRLFNNMLSSMPMCFNLFADLRCLLKTDPAEVSRIIKLLFGEIVWIKSVLEIDVEYIPTPITDYTNDRSAFDAMILVETTDGGKGLVSIETKYTDLLGSNISADSKTKNDLIRNGGFFSEDLVNELNSKGYRQIHRNFLLTYAFAKKNDFDRFVNIIISPEEDKRSGLEIDELRGQMTMYSDCIFKISLQDFVGRGMDCGHGIIEGCMKSFWERYLDF